MSDLLRGLRLDDAHLIETLRQTVRRLIRSRDWRPAELHGLAAVLLYLQRLPLVTPGVEVVIELAEPGEGSRTIRSLSVGSEGLRCEECRVYYDPAVGTDTESGAVFVAQPDGWREDGGDVNDQPYGWAHSFADMADDPTTEVSIEVLDTTDLDWQLEPDESAWDRLEND